MQESTVGAQFSGTIEHLFVKVGDRVTAGQTIASLKNNVTQQQPVQAKERVGNRSSWSGTSLEASLPSEIREAIIRSPKPRPSAGMLGSGACGEGVRS